MSTTVDQVIVAVEGARREWLQAADIIVAHHRWRWRASRWARRAHSQYPGCVVVMAVHTGGRWCLIRLPDHAVLVRGRSLTHAVAAIAHAAYVVWLDARCRPTNPLGG